MFVESSSAAVPIIENADFEVGISLYPIPDGVNANGSVIGGASLWIFDGIPEETQDAAWEFVKYLLEPEIQAEWTTRTGYFPVSQDVHETETYVEYLEEYPAFQTALDQLHLGDVNHVTQGAYIGVYPDIRVIMEDAFEDILQNDANISEKLDEANDAITSAMERYERTEAQTPMNNANSKEEK